MKVVVQKNNEQGTGLDDDDQDDHDNYLRRRSGRISPAGYEGVSTGPDPNNQGSQHPPYVLQNLLGTYPTGGGEGGDIQEEKSVGYPERALSLIMDMESINDQAEETAAAANDEGEEEEEQEDDNDWDGNFGKNIQE